MVTIEILSDYNILQGFIASCINRGGGVSTIFADYTIINIPCATTNLFIFNLDQPLSPWIFNNKGYSE